MPQVCAAAAGRGSDGGGTRPNNIDPSYGMSGLNFSDPVFLREILEHTPTPTAVVDGHDLRCGFANAAFRDLDLTAGQDVRGQGIAALFPAVDAGALSGVYRTGQRARVRAGTRDQRTWDLDVIPLRDGADGAVRALLVTAREVAAAEASGDQQLREINHRVKNTLQLVSSLLTLQALSAKDPDMRRAFQEACGRIGTVTQAHQRIHAVGRGSSVDFAGYLRDACVEMEASLAAGGAERRIVVTTDDAVLPVDSIIPLALIVNELVGNAIKYAYLPGAPGDVEVSLTALPEGGRRLTVADHGRGLPPGFDIARADTLGMKVARAFAGQLKSKLRAESNAPGARFVLDLPA